MTFKELSAGAAPFLQALESGLVVDEWAPSWWRRWNFRGGRTTEYAFGAGPGCFLLRFAPLWGILEQEKWFTGKSLLLFVEFFAKRAAFSWRVKKLHFGRRMGVNGNVPQGGGVMWLGEKASGGGIWCDAWPDMRRAKERGTGQLRLSPRAHPQSRVANSNFC